MLLSDYMHTHHISAAAPADGGARGDDDDIALTRHAELAQGHVNVVDHVIGVVHRLDNNRSHAPEQVAAPRGLDQGGDIHDGYALPAVERCNGAAQRALPVAQVRAELATSQVGIEMTGSGRRTKRLLVASGVDKALGGNQLLQGLDLILQPGQRLGVVGANGSGKSTLLKLLAGELEPDSGVIRRAEHLEIVHFDQARTQLDQRLSLRRALAPEGDSVLYRGREVHVVTWARRFQFRDDQLDQPVSKLSGGEQARVHIARLMLRPADLLLLDEPTNDLDIPTLEVLEESLLDFPGALVLVSHDRYLLDRVSTVLLGLDGAGAATPFADVEQWLTHRNPEAATPRREKPDRQRERPRRARLTYLEKREYEAMEETILEAEAELEAAAKRLADPEVASDAEAAHHAFLAEENARERVAELYHRWAERIAGGDFLLGHGLFTLSPFYSYLLAPIYAVAGSSMFTAILVQLLLGTAAVFAAGFVAIKLAAVGRSRREK